VKTEKNAQYVYLFGDPALNKVEDIRGLIGGKGTGLHEMTSLGLPVPMGFSITTEACNLYQVSKTFPKGMKEEVLAALAEVEKKSGKKFNDEKDPLLVSCRSGARFSMPGMMDTVLNIGMNDKTAKALIELSGDSRFVYDSYRRLVQAFGSVVLNISDEIFEHELAKMKADKGAKVDTDLTAENLLELTNIFKKIIKKEAKIDFPEDPTEQMMLAAKAVFESWNGKRAIDYRRATGISDSLGTAVNVVMMVFGNMGWDCGTGVVFTRNPATGENKLYGDYLSNAQGDDVVCGIRNTIKIQDYAKSDPTIYKELLAACRKLELHYQNMQDMEFTVERGKLWLLQTRNGKRTPQAAVRIALDLVAEKIISKEEAIDKLIETEQVDALLHPLFEDKVKKAATEAGKLFGKGINASPGAAVGRVYLDADLAEKMAKENGQKVIMARPFTKPDDVHGMIASEGIVTSEGGATSHAAVVARQFNIPSVVGAADIKIDLEKRTMTSNGLTIKEGDWISIDGGSGEVYFGELEKTVPTFSQQKELLEILAWADEICKKTKRKAADGKVQPGLQVWANADYPKEAKTARAYGAKGIGLCRTEHTFFDKELLPIVQNMILAEDSATRTKELDKLLPNQRNNFFGLFKEMEGDPVIIRLIDPPLHEFLPDSKTIELEIAYEHAKQAAGHVTAKVAAGKIAKLTKMLDAVERFHESNPMMGLRGVRLSIVMPEIVEMQVKAIIEGAAKAVSAGIAVKPEIMIPLTSHVNELNHIQPRLIEIAKEVMKAKGVKFSYKFGTMIEIPRAAVTAGEIAKVAEFFSFGTNDLTQMTYGLSRDDAERSFLAQYVQDGILPSNPFQTLDQDGVGEMMKIAIKAGREANDKLEVGICGEHGGDPASIEFCHTIGLNYVSCSPPRVPIARLAAAKAAIKHKI